MTKVIEPTLLGGRRVLRRPSPVLYDTGSNWTMISRRTLGALGYAARDVVPSLGGPRMVRIGGRSITVKGAILVNGRLNGCGFPLPALVLDADEIPRSGTDPEIALLVGTHEMVRAGLCIRPRRGRMRVDTAKCPRFGQTYTAT